MGCKQSCGCHGNGPEKGSAGVYPLIDRDLGEQPAAPLAVKRCVACDAKSQCVIWWRLFFFFFFLILFLVQLAFD